MTTEDLAAALRTILKEIYPHRDYTHHHFSDDLLAAVAWLDRKKIDKLEDGFHLGFKQPLTVRTRKKRREN